MANIKISALPAAATLTGAEEVPVVQSGVTVKTTVAAIVTSAVPTLDQVTTAGNETTNPIVFNETGASTAYVGNSTGNWLSLNGVAEVVPAGGIAPVTNNTYVLGSTSFRWAKLWATDTSLSGAITVAGNITPALLTASKPVFTDASKNLVSTGTLAYDQGGTGQTTYAAGDIVYASATNTLTKLPVGTNGQVLKVTAGLLPAWGTDSAGTGDVVGPASSTDNAIARFDTTTGKLIQNSAVTIADTTGDIVGTATQGVFNTVSTTVNAFGAATTLNVGAATGTMTVANTTLAAKAITASTTLGVTGVATLGNGAILGTPASMTATNITGTATAFTASNVTTNANLTGAVTSVGNATSLGSFSSANLSAALTDETGTGANVFATSPTLVTPLLGTPTSGTLTNCTFPTLNQNTSGYAEALKSATTTVSVSASAAPSNGQVLTATSSTAATWQTPASGASAATATALGTVYAKQTTSGGTPYLTALGYNAGLATTGVGCTAVGVDALKTNSTGTGNSAYGYQALTSSNGGNNTAMGYQALGSNLTSNSNVAIGYQSLYNHTGGGQNTGCGERSLLANTTGNYNCGLGGRALLQNTTGMANTAISPMDSGGNYSPVFDPTTESDRFCMGSTGITNAYIKVAWTVVSDARDKTEIKTVPHGLSFVNQLNPVSFKFRKSREDSTPHGPTRYGFLAQDILALEGVAPVVIDNEQSENLKYTDQNMTAILVKAIQELKAEFDAYKATHP